MKPFPGSLAIRLAALALFAISALPAYAAVSSRPAARRAAPAASAVSPVVIDVNGVKVTRAQFEKRALREMRRQTMQMGVTETMLMSPQMAEFRAGFESKVADALVSRMVLLNAAQKARMKVPGDSLQSAWNSVLRSFPSDDVMNEAFKRDGETNESVMKEIKESILISMYLEKKIGDPTASEAEAMEFYKENEERFTKPEAVHARHILINNDTNGLKTIQEIKRDLDRGGSFEELARTKSVCPSAPRGGDLGMFPRGQMVPEFEQAAFSLPAGKVSEPVKTQFGYHLILVEEHQTKQLVPFEEAKENCMKMAQQEKTADSVMALIAHLKKQSKIVNTISSAPPSPRAGMMAPVMMESGN